MKKNNVENFKGARGGRRPNAGRKFGAKSKTTLEREKVAEAVNQHIYSIAKQLINAQASLAQGVQILYKVKRTMKNNGNIVESKPEIVDDVDVISAYLAGELKDTGEEYFYITTKEPENGAIEGLLNRGLGKAKETVELQDATKLKLDF